MVKKKRGIASKPMLTAGVQGAAVKESFFRKFNVVDLIRYHNFANEKQNKKIKPMDLVRLYIDKYPELSARQQLENLFKGLKISHPLFNPSPNAKNNKKRS